MSANPSPSQPHGEDKTPEQKLAASIRELKDRAYAHEGQGYTGLSQERFWEVIALTFEKFAAEKAVERLENQQPRFPPAPTPREWPPNG